MLDRRLQCQGASKDRRGYLIWEDRTADGLRPRGWRGSDYVIHLADGNNQTKLNFMTVP